MTPAQNTAFQAGSGVTAPTLLTAIASVVLVLAFVWVIWVTLGTFRAWQNGQVALFDVILLLCPLMHIFMHGGHGHSHGAEDDSGASHASQADKEQTYRDGYEQGRQDALKDAQQGGHRHGRNQ